MIILAYIWHDFSCYIYILWNLRTEEDYRNGYQFPNVFNLLLIFKTPFVFHRFTCQEGWKQLQWVSCTWIRWTKMDRIYIVRWLVVEMTVEKFYDFKLKCSGLIGSIWRRIRCTWKGADLGSKFSYSQVCSKKMLRRGG